MKDQMMRVISSPSSSTTGFLTWIRSMGGRWYGMRAFALCDDPPMLGTGGSFQLARILGIRVGVNASWAIVLFLFISLFQGSFEEILNTSNTEAFAVAVVAAVLFFGSILLHELGHAFAARREGIAVSGIELFLFGGVMKMDRDTDSPGAEFRVAAAGPAVTLAIVLVVGAVGTALVGTGRLLDASRFTGRSEGIPLVLASTVVGFNLLLLVFNLIPAFPLDGGRIARAIAWRVTGDRGRATRFSARLGQGFAVLMIGYGLYRLLGGDAWGLWTIMLGWLLGSAARSAILQTAFSDRIEGITVADLMDAEPVTIPADLAAGRAYEEYFLRYQGWEWFAVVEADERYVGVAHREPVRQVAEGGGEGRAVRELVVRTGDEGKVPADTPLEALLGSEPLRRLGALMAVDRDGRLRGVVTLEQVSRALHAHLAAGSPGLG